MTRGLAIANTIIQVLLIVGVMTGMWLARTRRLNRHCLWMRFAVGVQIILIAAVMAPSLAAYVGTWNGWSGFTVELLVHHTLGVIVVLLFIFFNLVMTGVIRFQHRLRPYMWTASALWLIVLGLGLYLYRYIWK
jgi:hypothetical protein